MAAYLYPITIKRDAQPIRYEETRKFESDSLTLADLQFVGADPFYVTAGENGGYAITAQRTRLETDAERDARVAEGEAYMAEYQRRKAARTAV